MIIIRARYASDAAEKGLQHNNRNTIARRIRNEPIGSCWNSYRICALHQQRNEADTFVKRQGKNEECAMKGKTLAAILTNDCFLMFLQ